MPPSPARAAAFDILMRVERESSYASELLHATTYKRLSTQDHALATELVMGVLRWRSRLDQEICLASSHPLAKLDLEVLVAVRLALYQFRWLDRIPNRAALHESVELVKRARKRSAAPFANAVLRKLSITTSIPPADPTDAGTLASTLSHPLWLVERWIAQYGFQAALQICQHNQSVPPTMVRLRAQTAQAALANEGIQLQPGKLLASARQLQSGDVSKSESFGQGDFVIQDEASQLVATLIGRTKNGSRILDCCAAPGGKTLAMADQNPAAEITAVEIHPHRARLLQKLLHNSKRQIQTVVADATQLPLTTAYGRVLADVPCSGTGTLARNPEIKWRLKPEDLPELHARQLAILRSALAYLAPNGRLVYSTCSLEHEENEDVVETILREHASVQLINCGSELNLLKNEGELIWPNLESLTRGPYLRTIPGLHPCDGFFAAILGKR